MRQTLAVLVLVISISLTAPADAQPSTLGYHRQPALHGNKLIFVSEGDLFGIDVKGGLAHRLTSHPTAESGPVISPDGNTLAFSASYEGPREIYTMPVDGGRPVRRTFDASRCSVAAFSPSGDLIVATRVEAGLPDTQLISIALETGKRTRIPLAQAAQATFDPSGRTLFFTRLARQSSHTKRYRGGTAENLWKFSLVGGEEAIPLTADFVGTSSHPSYWNRRIYFLTDRGGSMNIWSMAESGGELVQHTHHREFDVKGLSVSNGKAAYQLGADLYLCSLTANESHKISIRLRSDFDHTRERWVDKPMDYLTSAHVSGDGSKVVLTARGQVFVAPKNKGRLVEASRSEGVRYRNARFLPDGESLLALSDESGEVELWKLPASGIGDRTQLTSDGRVLRWDAIPSPNEEWIAHHDKDWKLWMLNRADKTQQVIEESRASRYRGLTWSSDSRWLAYVAAAANTNRTIKLYSVENRTIHDVTGDRTNSYSPTWHPDGEWLYFLSDRNFQSLVSSPWGNLQPEPFFDRTTKLYHLALKKGLRSPFEKDNELEPKKKSADKDKDNDQDEDKDKDKDKDENEDKNEKKKDSNPKPIMIDLDGLRERIYEVPIRAGNYSNLLATKKSLLFTERDDLHANKRNLMVATIKNDLKKAEALVTGIRSSELSSDTKTILVRKGSKLYLVPASSSAPAKLDKKELDLSRWAFSLDPREEWRQMFVEAWRLERDYFYDREMHGVDWPAMLEKYLPFVDRVSDRASLSDLIAQMVSELSALHTFVYGGDQRSGTDNVQPASLGARLTREKNAGGYRIEHLYRADPDRPDLRGPLAHPHLDIAAGDVLLTIDGVSVLDAPHYRSLLRNRAGSQVRLRLRDTDKKEERDVIVTPISEGQAANLRYHEWELERRLMVDKLGEDQIGYVHLRAMGRSDIEQWAREFYPIFQRKGLIIDVRHNRGGNIDSWILEKLLRKAWFYWSGRTGDPFWNMQYAFRGHLVVLCNEKTASDGEAFSEGFRRLGLGKVIGTRTWGGEIWLSSSNFLVDRGIATSAEWGVYGPEGEWLIEGHGVDPDFVVDNLPHATFNGKDTQLEAAVTHLQKRIEEDPVEVPPQPKGPDKSWR